MDNTESAKARLFRMFYEKICGRHPDINMLHFQYLAAYQLKAQLKPILNEFSGVCLDLGCGSQPYKAYMPNITRYIGADIIPIEGAEILIKDNVLPPTGEVDCVLSTQVLEHTADMSIFAQVFERVAWGGKIVISVPFLYHAHGSPFDFRRFTKEGLRLWIESYGGIKVKSVQIQGGIGSTSVILFLAWLEANTTRSAIGKTVKLLGMPIFIPFCFVCNVIGILLDKLDRTGAFYNNAIVIALKE
jgi:SAM-dependent methyltransferase